VPIIGILLCGYLIAQLPWETWLRFVIWLVIGMVIYFTYSRRHSRVRTGEKAALPHVGES
jgi:APA family basic amino acid/polyamine antiporter